MKLIQKAVGLGRTLRAQLNIRTRQPLQSITVVTKNQKDEAILQKHGQHIKDELNVKEVLFSDKEDDLIQTEIKPNFPVLGPKLGKRMGELSKALKSIPEKAVQSLENGEEIEVIGLKLNSESLDIIKKAKSPDQEIETHAGVTVFYDTDISEDLIAEGVAREVVNRIQRMRKEADFHVSDRISVGINASTDLQTQVEKFIDYIKHETLTTELSFSCLKTNDIKQAHSIENEEIEISLRRS